VKIERGKQKGAKYAKGLENVTIHVIRLKPSEKHDCRTLAEISDSCIKHGFKMSFSLTVFSLQPIHLSSYYKTIAARVK
jgi:hypothetical protein